MSQISKIFYQEHLFYEAKIIINYNKNQNNKQVLQQSKNLNQTNKMQVQEQISLYKI